MYQGVPRNFRGIPGDLREFQENPRWIQGLPGRLMSVYGSLLGVLEKLKEVQGRSSSGARRVRDDLKGISGISHGNPGRF